MKNLAGDKNCDSDIRKELEAAGIKIVVNNADPEDSEVPSTLTGKIGNWTLERLWYYWAANAEAGKGFPKKVAEELNKRFGGEVRIDGYAGGTEVSGWLEQGCINSYHIDTQEGLNAFATLVAVLKLR